MSGGNDSVVIVLESLNGNVLEPAAYEGLVNVSRAAGVYRTPFE